MFTNLVLSGGAIKGLCFLGVIKFLEEKEAIQHINTFVGASSGSLVCFLACLGYKHQEMLTMCKSILSQYNSQSIKVESLLNINVSLGIDDGKMIEKWIKKTTFDRYGCHDITFLEFAKKTGKNFVVCASCLTTRKPFYFSVDTTPNVLVSDAIRASIAIPLIFTPMTIGEDLFIDAGVFNNFPIDYINNVIVKNTLGVSIKSKDYKPKLPLNLLSYFHLILDTVIDRINLKTNVHSNIISLVIDDSDDEIFHFNFNTMKLDIEPKKIDVFIEKGYKAACSNLDLNGSG